MNKLITSLKDPRLSKDPKDLRPDLFYSSLVDCLSLQGELYVALNRAVSVIHTWHGEIGWDIYYNHSPEMKVINAAISKVMDTTTNGNQGLSVRGVSLAPTDTAKDADNNK